MTTELRDVINGMAIIYSFVYKLFDSSKLYKSLLIKKVFNSMKKKKKFLIRIIKLESKLSKFLLRIRNLFFI